MRWVTLIRRKRDGTEEREYMPAWLADAIIGGMPQAEPNTASIVIRAGNHTNPAPAKPGYSWRVMAAAIFDALGTPRTSAARWVQ